MSHKISWNIILPRGILALFAIAALIVIDFGCRQGSREPNVNTRDSTTTATEPDTIVKATTPEKIKKKTIVFFGNSLTAGYGLDDPAEAFPGLVQKKIDSLHLPYTVINAGLSGETTAGGESRIDWILRQPVDIFVLELGGNDGLRGIPIAETYKNLQSIIYSVWSKYPNAKIILAGMLVPPNMGSRYGNDFRTTFKKLADNNKVIFIPFLLEGVGGETQLNQADGIHPNIEGHKIVANNVWKALAPIL